MDMEAARSYFEGVELECSREKVYAANPWVEDLGLEGYEWEPYNIAGVSVERVIDAWIGFFATDWFDKDLNLIAFAEWERLGTFHLPDDDIVITLRTQRGKITHSVTFVNNRMVRITLDSAHTMYNDNFEG